MTYVNEASVIATSVIFIILGIVAVLLRIFGRQNRKVSLGVDDWLIVVAWVWNFEGVFRFLANVATSDLEFLTFRYFSSRVASSPQSVGLGSLMLLLTDFCQRRCKTYHRLSFGGAKHRGILPLWDWEGRIATKGQSALHVVRSEVRQCNPKLLAFEVSSDDLITNSGDFIIPKLFWVSSRIDYSRLESLYIDFGVNAQKDLLCFHRLLIQANEPCIVSKGAGTDVRDYD